jgi:hypothetical protein
MKVSVCRPSELNASDLELWHSFQCATDTLAGPFLTPEFVCAMSERRSDMRLAILEEGDKVVGFFPVRAPRLRNRKSILLRAL